jgi:hypothetical protein
MHLLHLQRYCVNRSANALLISRAVQLVGRATDLASRRLDTLLPHSLRQTHRSQHFRLTWRLFSSALLTYCVAPCPYHDCSRACNQARTHSETCDPNLRKTHLAVPK